MVKITRTNNKLKDFWLPNLLTLSILGLLGFHSWTSMQKDVRIPVVEAKTLSQQLINEMQKAPVAPSNISTDLVETVDGLTLPKIASDGTTPFRAYKRQPIVLKPGYNPVALIIEDMGLSDPILNNTLNTLSKDIALAFNPYAPSVNEAIIKARVAGFEVLLSLPMEPLAYPDQDAGNKSLRLNLSARENKNLLFENMSKGQQYIGMVSMFGSGFMESKPQITPIFKTLSDRGIAFVDNTVTVNKKVAIAAATEAGLPYLSSLQVGTALSKTGLAQQFDTIQKVANRNGYAVVTLKPYPLVLQVLEDWLDQQEARQIQLIPLSQQFTLRGMQN